MRLGEFLDTVKDSAIVNVYDCCNNHAAIYSSLKDISSALEKFRIKRIDFKNEQEIDVQLDTIIDVLDIATIIYSSELHDEYLFKFQKALDEILLQETAMKLYELKGYKYLHIGGKKWAVLKDGELVAHANGKDGCIKYIKEKTK